MRITDSTLADYPLEMVYVACRKCRRSAMRSKVQVLAEYGPGIPLLDLCYAVAACPWLRDMNHPCGAAFPDLSDEIPAPHAERISTSTR
jgi:hypothetical protein